MKILIVDNDAVLLKYLGKILTELGHDVLTAVDGLSAVDALGSVTPDFFFLDYVMPNVDGEGLCRIIRENRRFDASVVVLLSAVAAEEWINLKQAGADICIAKGPFGTMKALILQVMADPEGARRACAAGQVIGLENVSPRLISKELLASKRHFESLLNQMSEGILELNADHRVVFANPAALAIFERTAVSITGQTLHDLFPETPKTNLDERLSATRAGGKPTDRSLPVAMGDRKLTLEVVPLETGQHHRLAIINDISEHKRAEKRLKETNAFLTSLLNSSFSVSIISTDLSGNILFWNKGAENIFGYTAEEVVGKQKISILYPSRREIDQIDGIRETLKRDGGPITCEIREVTKDGRYIWMRIHLTPRVDGSGKFQGILGIGEDISESKRIEEEKDSLQVKLLQLQKLESIGTLAGGIAHDFNNLLMGIQGHTSLALLGLSEDDRCHRHLKAIEKFIQNGAMLTEQLLGFARSGQYNVQPSDVNRLVTETLQMFGRTRKEITIRKFLADDLWRVNVDQAQIQQVLMNICVNAWQAMQGNGFLTIRSENRVLSEENLRPYRVPAGKYVELAFTDTGTGMSRETQKKIFDPFFTTKDRGYERGTGMGLASAYGIIKNHDGIITVESEPGKGTTFRVYLPALSGNGSDEPLATGRTEPERKQTVLVVDDEELVLEVASDMIRMIGFEVMAVKSGREAIRIYGEHRDTIDVVILDMIMPDMSGGDVYDAIKNADPSCKVLLSSGYNLDGDAQAILDRGCNGFIQKPFSIQKLGQSIREILDS